ncbi:MAG: hypothetical protein R3F49_20205 [Planctomycetota bacterium]
MVPISAGFVAFVVGTAVTLVVPVLAFWLLYRVFQVLFAVLGGGARLVGSGARRIGRFVQGVMVDSLHLVGGVITAGVIFPLSVANVLIGRMGAARHYGRALEDELMSSLLSLYRIGLGHPARLFGLSILTDGVERRIPELVARAPRTGAVPARRAAAPRFAGYDIERELPAGGSGARLFLARVSRDKARDLAQRGHAPLGKVVIKCFDRSFGSTLPQIVRESRALEAAKRLGHVLEHELDNDHFHYVMPYVPGEDLDVITRRLHAESGDGGLDRRALAKVLGYTSDLCATLERFHAEGLWHKDIKPANLLVSGDRLQVVDLGLVTPLASALTLTTHGTEYFRDPELVRLAMRGVKVHEVDGVKFDLYSAGAVLFSMLENSFPAHGSLSRLTKPVPEALAWIVRRAMSDISQRYASATVMRRDVAALLAAQDPFSVRPAELPSFRAAQDEPRAALAAAPAVGAAERAETYRRAADSSARHEGSTPPPRTAPVSAASARRCRRRQSLAAYGLVAMALCMAGGVKSLHAYRSEGAAVRPYAKAAAGHASRNQSVSVAPPAMTPAALRGKVLVYLDPGVASDSAWRPLVERVSESGFEPVGLEGNAQDIDWLAAVGRIVEGAPLAEPTTVARVERWLSLHEDELSAVLWLGQGSRPGAVAAKLVAVTDSDTAAPLTSEGSACSSAGDSLGAARAFLECDSVSLSR